MIQIGTFSDVPIDRELLAPPFLQLVHAVMIIKRSPSPLPEHVHMHVHVRTVLWHGVCMYIHVGASESLTEVGVL